MKILQKSSRTFLILCGVLLFAIFPATVFAAPKKVSGMKCGVTTQSSINISWSGQSGISGYQVFRSPAYDGEYRKIMNVSPHMRAFCNKNLPSGQEYYYKVRSYRKSGGRVSNGKFSKALRGYTKMAAPQKAVVRARVNIRKHAGTTHPVLTTLSPNTTVSIICSARDKAGADWKYVKCTVNGRTYKGYISSSLLQKDSPSRKQKAKVTANSLNVRANAGMGARVTSNLKRGQSVTVLGFKKAPDGSTWAYVQLKKNGRTVKGYVSSRYIRIL